MAEPVQTYAEDESCGPPRAALGRRVRRARSRRVVASLVITLLASGCFWRHPPVATRALTLQTAAAANDNRPISVAAVMVYDQAVLATVAKMTASQWFAEREQLRNDSPNGLDEQDWELVPGSQLRFARLPFPRKGLGLFVFANYASPGEHRVRLDDWRQPSITLGERTLTVGGKK